MQHAGHSGGSYEGFAWKTGLNLHRAASVVCDASVHEVSVVVRPPSLILLELQWYRSSDTWPCHAGVVAASGSLSRTEDSSLNLTEQHVSVHLYSLEIDSQNSVLACPYQSMPGKSSSEYRLTLG